MPNTRQPRSGSLQFWPRKRAKKHPARIRTYPEIKEPGLTGFLGFKVGMAHVMAIETNKNSPRKGEEVSIPVTVVECPPVKLYSVRFYKNVNQDLKLKKEILLAGKDKELAKKIKLPQKLSKPELDKIQLKEYDEIRVLIYTQPHKTNIGKKVPEIIEMGLGGNLEDKLSFVKENIEKELHIDSVFNEGDLTDIRAITKGKGFQGPVKRFGISIRQAKSEKSIRNPGSLGPWKGQGHIMWRVAHAGKMGFHQRTEYNKQILSIVTDSKEINPKSGWHKYGVLKNNAILIKGSVAGAKKRTISFQKPLRHKKEALPTIQKISLK